MSCRLPPLLVWGRPHLFVVVEAVEEAVFAVDEVGVGVGAGAEEVVVAAEDHDPTLPVR